MKRKIITQKQLDRLVSLGVVVLESGDYRSAVDAGILIRGAMSKELLGSTVEVEGNYGGSFPYKTKEELSWYVPAFILACNYKKMLAKAKEMGK